MPELYALRLIGSWKRNFIIYVVNRKPLCLYFFCCRHGCAQHGNDTRGWRQASKSIYRMLSAVPFHCLPTHKRRFFILWQAWRHKLDTYLRHASAGTAFEQLRHEDSTDINVFSGVQLLVFMRKLVDVLGPATSDCSSSTRQRKLIWNLKKMK